MVSDKYVYNNPDKERLSAIRDALEAYDALYMYSKEMDNEVCDIYSLVGLPQNSCNIEVRSSDFYTSNEIEIRLLYSNPNGGKINGVCTYYHHFKMDKLSDLDRLFELLFIEISETTKKDRRDNQIGNLLKDE